MTENITIKALYVNNASKDGTPFKNGQVMVSIKDAQDRRMSNFFPANHPVTQMRPGDTLSVDLEQKGQFLNFVIAGAPGGSQRPQQPYQAPQSPAWVGTPQGQEQLSRMERKLDEVLAALKYQVTEPSQETGDIESTVQIPF